MATESSNSIMCDKTSSMVSTQEVIVSGPTEEKTKLDDNHVSSKGGLCMGVSWKDLSESEGTWNREWVRNA